MTRRTEALVGASIVMGLALVIFGTLFLKGVKLGREEEVIQARFREVSQLQKGNAVKVRGVPIGQVDEIALEEGGSGVLVSMRIDGEVTLPADPVVVLSPESMFGDWQAEIFPRSQFPQYAYAEAPDPKVLPGFTIPDISRLTVTADRIAENLAVLTERIEIAFTEETALNLREVISNIQKVSSELTSLVEAQQRTVENVASDLETTSETLGQAAETVRRTFSEVERAIGKGQLADIMGNIQATSAELDSLTSALVLVSNRMGSAVASADTTFRSFNVIVGSLERGQGTLGKLFRDTTLYAEVVNTNAQLQALLKDFQANPRKYINLEIF